MNNKEDNKESKRKLGTTVTIISAILTAIISLMTIFNGIPGIIDTYNKLSESCAKQHGTLHIDDNYGNTAISEYDDFNSKVIFVDEDNLLHVNMNYFGMSKNQLEDEIGIKIDDPIDYPWWGVDLTASWIECENKEICLMFQYEKLVIIYYDIKSYFKEPVWDKAVKISEGKYNLEGYIDRNTGVRFIGLPFSAYLQMFQESYSETGETVFRQQYVAYDMEW